MTKGLYIPAMGKKKSGWKGERQRHSVSRRGVKTTVNINNVKSMRINAMGKRHEFADDLPFWNAIQIREFEKEFGKIESVEDGYNRDVIIISENGEYRVFKDYDDAYETAKEELSDSFESDPDTFPVDWVVEENITISDTDRRIIAGEESDNYVENFTDVDVIHESDPDSYKHIQEQIDEYEEKISNLEEELDVAVERGDGSESQISDRIEMLEINKRKLENEQEEFIEESKESLREKAYNVIYDDLSDPVQYFIKDHGYYSDVQDLINSNIISIDYEGMATTVLDADGVAHILASYDGHEYEIGNAVIYRTN